MKDIDKTKEQLIKELMELRHQHSKVKVSATGLDGPEEAQRKSEEKCLSLFETPESLTISIDDKENIIDCSPRNLTILGYAPHEIIDQPLSKILHSDYISSPDEKIGEVPDAETLAPPDLKLVCKSGAMVDVTIKSEELKAEKGSTVRTMCITEHFAEGIETEEKPTSYQKQLRSLASQLASAENRFRRQVAAELHDHIGQNLVTLKLQLELLRKPLSSLGHTFDLERAFKLIEQASEGARSLSFKLTPPLLYELGIVAAIEEYLEEFEDNYGIESSIINDGHPKPLDEEVLSTTFQIVRELLTNVVKHAQARNVTVEIRSNKEEMTVSVEDDGGGFQPEKSTMSQDRSGGYGLFSARERLRYLGGRLKIESKPGRNSKVIFHVPLKITQGPDAES